MRCSAKLPGAMSKPTEEPPRRRRVSRGPTSLGHTSEGMTRLPAHDVAPSGESEDSPPLPEPPRGRREGVLPRRATEDIDENDTDNNDERLLRDKPPHWR